MPSDIAISASLISAADAFEIAEEQFSKGDIKTLKEEYPRMKKTIEKGLEQLSNVVM